MKRILLLLPFLYCTVQAHLFEFIDNKKNGALDTKFLKNIIATFQCDTFFETGTYNCATTLNAIPLFKTVYTVELFSPLFNQAKLKLAPYKNTHPYFGKSPEIINQTAAELSHKNVLFWLDAHYSGPGTALSNPNESDPEAVTAIRAELKAIKDAQLPNCTILIDDIRGFGTKINDQEFLGCWAYPSLQEVKAMLLAINKDFKLMLLGDTLLAYDAAKYQPQFSETAVACTKTRLYDGANLTNAELIAYEEKIMRAPRHEKACIRELYHQMTQWKDPMFWHDLWKGLVEIGDNNFIAAHEALSKVPVRVQYFTKNRGADNTILYLNHPSLERYTHLCK